MARHEDEIRRHPSFGMASITNVSGHANLFGSDFQHMHFVGLRISEADERRDLGLTRYFSGNRLIEVWMSHSQFAQLITSPGSEGVPVTLRWVRGKGMLPDPPSSETANHIVKEKDEHVKLIQNEAERALQMAQDILDGKEKLTKGTVAALRDLLRTLSQDVSGNIDYINKCMTEHMERTVSAGKTELENHVRVLQQRAGAQAMGGEVPIRLSESYQDPPETLDHCAAAKDGECNHPQCPQLRDGEPKKTGRSCPLQDLWDDTI